MSWEWSRTHAPVLLLQGSGPNAWYISQGFNCMGKLAVDLKVEAGQEQVLAFHRGGNLLSHVHIQYIQTFSPIHMHTHVHDSPAVYKMLILSHQCALPCQTPDWILRSRFDFLLKGLLCRTTLAYEIKYVQYCDLIWTRKSDAVMCPPVLDY